MVEFLMALWTATANTKAAPMLELVALFHQRWEIESVFDELSGRAAW